MVWLALETVWENWEPCEVLAMALPFGEEYLPDWVDSGFAWLGLGRRVDLQADKVDQVLVWKTSRRCRGV